MILDLGAAGREGMAREELLALVSAQAKMIFVESVPGTRQSRDVRL
jgi:hypothetical protein